MSVGRANGKCRGLQKKGGFLNATTSHCCAWTNTRALYNTGVLRRGDTSDYCGTTITEPGTFGEARGQCCAQENATTTSEGDCDSSKWPKGPAFGAVIDFAEREKDWLKFYQQAWWTATENGQRTQLQPSAQTMDKRQKRRKDRMKQKQGKNQNKKTNNKKQGGGSKKMNTKKQEGGNKMNSKKQQGGNKMSGKGGRSKGKGRGLSFLF